MDQLHMSPAKSALLRRWRAGYQVSKTSRLDVPPRGASTPLTFAQQKLFVVEQLIGPSSALNLSFCCWIDGPIDLEVLERSAHLLLARHETLRTTIHVDNGIPRQIVAQEAHAKLEIVDLKGAFSVAADTQALELATIAAQESFDLERGPLARMKLFLLDEGHSLMLVVIHHIVGDGWSLGVALRDLLGLYEAQAEGRPADLSDLRLQYGDFANWQRDSARLTEWQPHLDYWQQRLSGVTPIELSRGRSRLSQVRLRGCCQEIIFPESLSRDIRSFARQHSVTPFMVLLACLNALLGELARTTDIAVASPVAGRVHADTYDLVGLFINILVLRTDMSGDPTFLELLRRTRETCLHAQSNQAVPMELVERSLPRATRPYLGTETLTNILFVLQNSPMPALNLASSTLRPVELEWGTARYDFELYLWDDPQAFRGRIQYKAEVFEVGSIRQISAWLVHLAKAAIVDPARPSSHLVSRSRPPEEISRSEKTSISPITRRPRTPIALDQRTHV